jgi:hypothetical protein
MGDTTTQPGAPAEFPRQDAAAIAPPPPVRVPTHSTTVYSPAFAGSYPPQHEQFTGPQYAFTSQIEMTHQQRPGSFYMSAMAHTLPQGHYQGQPYGHGPQRYTTAAPQMPTAQFGAPHTLGPMPTHQYYLSQHAHMAQFYQTPLSAQPPTTMPARHDMGYYPSPVVMNQPSHTHFYYTPGAAFPGHPPHAQGHVSLGQYGQPNSHQHQNTRSPLPPPGGNEALPASPGPQINGTPHCPGATRTTVLTNYSIGANGSHHGIVRGPPRKPRQSGKHNPS